jgi:catechol 2,3-dioxygenase-like lactoylglutathione lyase family enzyme
MSKHAGTRITGVRAVSIPVSDVDRARDFYTTTLGFEVRLDVPYGDGRHWLEVAAPGARTSIALAPSALGQEPGVDTGIRFETTDVEADHADLKARGVDVDPEILRWPNSPPMFQLRDPDGNLLRVIQRIEESQPKQHGEARVRQGGTAGKRFVVLVRSDAATESDATPDEDSLADMIAFNDRLVNDGLLLAADGFHASADGARIRFSEGSTTVVRGPFPEPETLIAGFWMIQAGSLEEAIERMRRAPMGGDAEIELRQVFEADEFGEAYTPELREREDRQRVRMEANAKRHAT